MTDGEQFGFEKPNFPDETFYYPYCDCEDRAMLYSTLVRDLLGLDTILLDYPNHIASAVRFTEDIPGDYVVLDDGSKYLICDSTYIGAPIGAWTSTNKWLQKSSVSVKYYNNCSSGHKNAPNCNVDIAKLCTFAA